MIIPFTKKNLSHFLADSCCTVLSLPESLPPILVIHIILRSTKPVWSCIPVFSLYGNQGWEGRGEEQSGLSKGKACT